MQRRLLRATGMPLLLVLGGLVGCSEEPAGPLASPTTGATSSDSPSPAPTPVQVVIGEDVLSRFDRGQVRDAAARAVRLSEDCGWQPALVLRERPDAEHLGACPRAVMSPGAASAWDGAVRRAAGATPDQQSVEDVFSLVTWGLLGLSAEDSDAGYRLLPPEDGTGTVRGVTTGQVVASLSDGDEPGVRLRFTSTGDVLVRDPAAQPVAVSVERDHDMVWVPGDAGRPWLLDAWTTDRMIGEPALDTR